MNPVFRKWRPIGFCFHSIPSLSPPTPLQVEKIIGHKQIGRDVTYRIRWKGWGSKDDTWQAEEDLNCEAILDKYKASIRRICAAAGISFMMQ